MSKRTFGSSRDLKRHPGRRGIPSGMLVIECDDPRCIIGMQPGAVSIHHLDLHGEEPAPQREEATAANGDLFADPSDLTSEGGSGEQRTKTD